MKKILKYTLLAIVIIIAVCALLHQIFLAKTFEFVLAARDNDIPHMEQMIKDGYDPVADRYFGDGVFRVYIAMSYGNEKKININTAKYLLDIGLSPNMIAKNKPSPLQLAIVYNQPELVKLLIERGADINYEMMGYTALDTALKLNRYEMIDFFPLKNARLGKIVGKNPVILDIVLLEYMQHPKKRDISDLFIKQGYYTEDEVEEAYQKLRSEVIKRRAKNKN